jgi:hypothetical protein
MRDVGQVELIGSSKKKRFKNSQTLDPEPVAHEHRSLFFPDNGHGAANAAGFG